MSEQEHTAAAERPAETTSGVGETSAREIDDLREERRPLWARVGIVVLAVALALFVAPFVLKLFVPPINPTQPAPPNHVSLDCNACHTISADVPVKGVR